MRALRPVRNTFAYDARNPYNLGMAIDWQERVIRLVRNGYPRTEIAEITGISLRRVYEIGEAKRRANSKKPTAPASDQAVALYLLSEKFPPVTTPSETQT